MYNCYGPYLHNIEEVIVDLGLISKLELDLIEIGEGVLNLQPLEGWRLGGWRPCRGRLLLLSLLTDPTERGGGREIHRFQHVSIQDNEFY